MRSWLDSTPRPFTSPSTPSPPSYTNSNHINGKYNAHQDSEFKGGYVDIRMQKDVNFCPEKGDIEKIHKDGPWVAAIIFRVKDLPAAMKQGLYCSQDNVDLSGCCFYDDLQSMPPAFQDWGLRLQDWGLTHARRFQLIDLAENPQWKATLFVVSRGIKPLCRFRIQTLSVNNILGTAAFTRDGKLAYMYNRAEPERNFNAIYDDMPLRGWWPWPKNSSVSDDQETSLLARFKTIHEGSGY
ncbi:hypothetical protein E5D57_008176 [Metarhizium anisopliae]|nr:hypothetical protein E5D57_008176 [Metarhizium anisopliae]